jgi:hypothetical protein
VRTVSIRLTLAFRHFAHLGWPLSINNRRFWKWYNYGMTTEQFRAMLHQQPFRPFVIRMADGRAFEVAHRDFVAVSPTGRTIIVYQDNENFSVLDLLLMSELQVVNGRSV